MEVVCRGGKRRGSRCRDGIVLLVLMRMLWQWFWLLWVDDVRRRHRCPVEEPGRWGWRQRERELGASSVVRRNWVLCFFFSLCSLQGAGSRLVVLSNAARNESSLGGVCECNCVELWVVWLVG